MIHLVSDCSVLPASSKGKGVMKPKIVGTRSQEERRFLLDIVTFLANSRSGGKEELFSFHSKKKERVVLSARSVRDELKKTCELHGLPKERFSTHSLRKASMSDMRALGASEDDRRDRGSYAASSTVMAESYEYATGPGPLACMALEGGYLPTTEDTCQQRYTVWGINYPVVTSGRILLPSPTLWLRIPLGIAPISVQR